MGVIWVDMGVIWVDTGVIWGNMGSYGGHIGVLWGGKCAPFFWNLPRGPPPLIRGESLSLVHPCLLVSQSVSQLVSPT